MIRKANAKEKVEYKEIDAVYPLYGFTTITGILCPIEYLGDVDPENRYEIVLPDGYEFLDKCTTRLCRNLKELKIEIKGEEVSEIKL